MDKRRTWVYFREKHEHAKEESRVSEGEVRLEDRKDSDKQERCIQRVVSERSYKDECNSKTRTYWNLMQIGKM